jgi:ppGpp synthetase/RelA/SpoT-type nucleotidyltranferase
MSQIKVPIKTRKAIKRLVKFYEPQIPELTTRAQNLVNLLRDSEKLKPYVHSIKYRIKEPSHLKDKLLRKARDAQGRGKSFDIKETNLFTKVPDLVGIRILHLHTKQMKHINEKLREIFKDEQYVVKEGPEAKTWDDEYRGYFESIQIPTTDSKSMYTSVHYVVAFNNRAATRFELQVRTLFEEVWGEVSHKIDYPHPTESLACKEQIKVLARLTSSGTRLVDSIFETLTEYQDLSGN